MKPAALLQRLQELCVLCKELCADVEFVAADATRADADTLHRALQIALEAGVGRITLCDAAGLQLPDEMASMLQTLYAALPALADVQLGIACGNTLYMSCAGAVAAVQSGATVIKTAVVGDACPTPEAVSALMQARGDQLGWQCGLQQAQIRRLSKQIRWIADTRRSEGSPFDAGVRNPGEAPMLGRGEDAAQVETTVRSLGYDLTAEDMARVQEAIRGVSTHKTLTAQELEVIINTVALQVPPTYVLRDYAVHTSDVISASAQITLQKQDRTLQGISLGDGPIDASFLAIEQILGRHFEVDDFQIQAVTQGREAMGSALVKLRSHGKVYAGSGVSTDIIGASIRAYLNALNKIVYEETAL